MRVLSIVLCLTFALPASALAEAAKAPEPRAERLRDEVASHRAMAAAHEKAARCLESGKPEKDCHEQLFKDCKGVGIGKHCGMRHRH